MQPHRFPSCLLIFLLVCGVQTAWAQYADKDFVRYTAKDGLSANRVTCLQQDDWGYLWVGTENGLNRFDGNTFKKFFQADAPLRLPSDVVNRLKRLGAHRLGVITRGGFQVLNTKTFAVQDYIIPDSTAFTTPLNGVWDVRQLQGGSFALSTAAGFYVLNEQGRLVLRHDVFNVHDIGRKRILYGRDIFSTASRKYIVYVNEDEQALYDDERKTFQPLTGAEPEWKPYVHPHRIVNDRWLTKQQVSDHEYLFVPIYRDSIVYYNSRLNKRVVSPLPFAAVQELSWASNLQPVNDSTFVVNCGNTGFYRLTLNRRTGAVTGDGKKYLSRYEITSLFSDKDGRLWVGTSEGLLKQELTPPFVSTFRYPKVASPVYSGFFYSAYRYKNEVYLGRYGRSNGLVVIDAATMQLKKTVSFYGNDSPWNEVFSIEMYHPDTLWVGTWAGLLWYAVKSGRYGKVLDEKKYPWAAWFAGVLAPPRSDGYAWMCSYLSGRVARYHIPSRTFTVFSAQTTPELPFEKVKSIAYDSYGDVWIGGHALARWNNRLQRFDTLINVYGGANKFNDDILCLSADARGSLWVHNVDNGLLEYRIAEKKFVAYGMKDGLPSNSLPALSRVIDDKLWIAAGNNQLSMLDVRSRKFIVYNQDDGLPEQAPSTRQIYYDRETGKMYLCCQDHLVRFPLTPQKKADSSSALLLEEVTVNNQGTRYQPAGAVEVAHNENNLRFDFTVVDFEKGTYRFAYRLNGGAWTPLGEQRSLSFSNLSPGEYRVELKAVGKQGTEKTKSFRLVVQPPFWLRPWFLVLVAVLFALTVYGLFQARVRRVRQRANLDKQLSQTEMKALQAQMNPHFIFNSLNSIREMILNNENKEASHYLSKFAHLIRLTLDQSSHAVVSLRSTVDYLNRYMEMETIRNGLLTYAITVDKRLDVDETFLSPMLIQPFIENAIWHGVSATRKNIHINVAFRKKKEVLVCTVDDNGVGIARAQSLRSLNGSRHQSHGIANIKNRLTLLNEKYNLCCSINIVDKKETLGIEESGTLVTLQLPLQTNES